MEDNLILEGLLSMVTELKERQEKQVMPASREETINRLDVIEQRTPNMVKVSCFMPTASIHGESCLPHPHAQRYAHQNNHAVPESDWLRHALHKTGPDS